MGAGAGGLLIGSARVARGKRVGWAAGGGQVPGAAELRIPAPTALFGFRRGRKDKKKADRLTTGPRRWIREKDKGSRIRDLG